MVKRASHDSVLLSLTAVPLRGPHSAQRLPATVIPDHYDLKFVVDLANARFDGDRNDPRPGRRADRQVVLNAAEITFAEVTIGNGAATQTATVALDEATRPRR